MFNYFSSMNSPGSSSSNSDWSPSPLPHISEMNLGHGSSGYHDGPDRLMGAPVGAPRLPSIAKARTSRFV